MRPELSRRLGQALGAHTVTPDERDRVIRAVTSWKTSSDVHLRLMR